VRFETDRLDLTVGGVERDDRGLVQDDSSAASEDARVGSAKVNRDVAGECRKEVHWAPLKRRR
jgi:hypothetical protein